MLELIIGIIASIIATILVYLGSVLWKKYFPKISIKKTPEEQSQKPETQTVDNEELKRIIQNIPFHRNPNFTGRVKYLDDLGNALKAGKTTALTQTMHGLGGIGKTQIALEYCYRHLDDYKIIWWFRAESTITLASDYALLAEGLNLPEKDARETDVKVEAVKRYLENNCGWLLIFDNAENQDEIIPYIPKTARDDNVGTGRDLSEEGECHSPLQSDIASYVPTIGRQQGMSEGELPEGQTQRSAPTSQFNAHTVVGAGSKPAQMDLTVGTQLAVSTGEPPSAR